MREVLPDLFYPRRVEKERGVLSVVRVVVLLLYISVLAPYSPLLSCIVHGYGDFSFPLDDVFLFVRARRRSLSLSLFAYQEKKRQTRLIRFAAYASHAHTHTDKHRFFKRSTWNDRPTTSKLNSPIQLPSHRWLTKKALPTRSTSPADTATSFASKTKGRLRESRRP